ncbi:MAG: M14 family zinc carboxypeptidase [Planctomycetota bacterium]
MERLCLAALLALLSFTPFAFAVEDIEIFHLIEVKSATARDFLAVQAMGMEILRVNPETGDFEVVAPDSRLGDLVRAGIIFEMRIEDMASFYADRLAQAAPPEVRAFPDGSMGGHYTNSEVIGLLDDWAVQYPHLISPKQSIGQTIEGRDIWAVKVSDNPTLDEDEPEVLFESLIHCREPQGMMTLIYYMIRMLEDYGVDEELTYLVDNREIWFVPVLNPDGYLYNEQTYPGGGGMWRKNRRNNGGGTYGVDLNRNWAYMWGYDNIGSSPYPGDETYRGTGPFSEPETQAISDFLLSRPITTHWDTHCYGNYYLCPFGYDNVLPYGQDWDIYQEYLADISAVNGYAAGPVPGTLGYYVNGGSIDWIYQELGAFSIAPELGSTGFWPSKSEILPLAIENLMPLTYWTWVGGSYVQLNSFSLDDDNGDGNIHPGEPAEITIFLRNKGVSATLTDVVASISTTNPHVTIQNGYHNFGSVAGYTEVDNGNDPFAIEVDSWISYGETITFDVDITFDDFMLTQQVHLTCGVPVIFIADDFETNLGWTVQNTNVQTGEWERADPAGTSAQPEDDHTPTGTMCYVTGKLGGSSGNDDLDGGPTRLITPLMDLSSGNAEVSYWCWFYHSDYGTQQPLAVEISNDNGGTWKKVEDITHKPQWTQHSFNVADFVTPTSEVLIRFSATDNPNDDVVEALIDDFEVKTFNPPVQLTLVGTPAIGSTVNVEIDAPSDPDLGYFMAASTITYPVLPIGDRYFPLGWDFMLVPFSIKPGNGVFNNFFGFLDGAGHSSDPEFVIPYLPMLIGVDIFFAAGTLDAGSPEGVKNLSAPLPITVE